MSEPFFTLRPRHAGKATEQRALAEMERQLQTAAGAWDLAGLLEASASALDAQEVPEHGRWLVVRAGLFPELRHSLLIDRQRQLAAARRKRRQHQRCGAKR